MTLLNLKDNIKTILGGTPEETAGFRRSFFHLADTPQLLKDLGLIGDYFSIRYGVITRHKGKDVDHALTAQNWIDLCDEIIRPFAIVRFETGYRMLVNVKVDGNFAAVGVEVKNTGKSFDINAITSVYGRKGSVKRQRRRFCLCGKKPDPGATSTSGRTQFPSISSRSRGRRRSIIPAYRQRPSANRHFSIVNSLKSVKPMIGQPIYRLRPKAYPGRHPPFFTIRYRIP